MLEYLINWIKQQKGQDLVEYALIAGLIAVVCVLIIAGAGDAVSTIWSAVSTALASAAGAL